MLGKLDAEVNSSRAEPWAWPAPLTIARVPPIDALRAAA